MDGKKIFIGRNSQCDYVIDPRYESVSGDHCTLTEELNEKTGAVLCYRLEEYSTNGTHINTQLVHHSTFYVHRGDHITLAKQYVLEWDKIDACFAAQSRKTVNRPVAPVSPASGRPYVPSTPPDPRATQRRPTPIQNQWGGDNAATVRNAPVEPQATMPMGTISEQKNETVMIGNSEPTAPVKKKRNGFVTFCLVFAIIVNIVSPIGNGIYYSSLSNLGMAGLTLSSNGVDTSSFSQVHPWVWALIITGGIFAILNIIGFAKLLRWKKAGYYIFCVSSVVSAIATIFIGMNLADIYTKFITEVTDQGYWITLNHPFSTTFYIVDIVSAVIVPLIWRGILAIRRNGNSCWSQLS